MIGRAGVGAICHSPVPSCPDQIHSPDTDGLPVPGSTTAPALVRRSRSKSSPLLPPSRPRPPAGRCQPRPAGRLRRRALPAPLHRLALRARPADPALPTPLRRPRSADPRCQPRPAGSDPALARRPGPDRASFRDGRRPPPRASPSRRASRPRHVHRTVARSRHRSSTERSPSTSRSSVLRRFHNAR